MEFIVEINDYELEVEIYSDYESREVEIIDLKIKGVSIDDDFYQMILEDHEDEILENIEEQRGMNYLI